MQATDLLSSDHRLIERLVTAMEVAADRMQAGESVRPTFFRDVVRFIQGYADGTHHRKEEGVLFPAMAAGGMPTEMGPIAVMLHEHQKGRELTARLKQAADALAQGEAAARREAVVSALGYAQLLRQHIAKEDNILFPMAGRVIPVDEHDSVLQRFENVDRERAVGEGRADYVALLELLEREMERPTALS